MGHNSGKKCRKILIIEFDLDTPKIHLHTTSSFNLTFYSQEIIHEPKIQHTGSMKKGHNSGKNCRKKSSFSNLTQILLRCTYISHLASIVHMLSTGNQKFCKFQLHDLTFQMKFQVRFGLLKYKNAAQLQDKTLLSVDSLIRKGIIYRGFHISRQQL